MSRISAFWKAIIILLLSWAVMQWAVQPVMPQSLLLTYLLIIFLGVLLYFTSDDDEMAELTHPVLAMLRDDDKALQRMGFVMAASILAGFLSYQQIKPSVTVPVEVRQVHPSPPGSLRFGGERYDMDKLENPIRKAVLANLKTDPETAWETYQDAVKQGSELYFQNCFFCHGNALDGRGHYAQAFDPHPTNFTGSGSIAQLSESFLFWRINTGGAGLPNAGMPWRSVMPVWHEKLDAEQVWQLITYLYDDVGQVPRLWDHEQSRIVSAMNDEIKKRREKMTGDQRYQFRCAVCHGEQGAGDGPAAEFVSPRPRDFSLGIFKYKTTPGALPPSDEDLFRTIKYGLNGTSMTGWEGVLTDPQIRELIPVLKKFDTAAIWSPEDADEEAFDEEGRYLKTDFKNIKQTIALTDKPVYDTNSIERGRQVFEENCKKCHGAKARGNRDSGKFMDDDWGQRLWARDLTLAWTFRSAIPTGAPDERRRDALIDPVYTIVSIGIPGTPMPAHQGFDGEEDPISAKDRWHVAHYVYSLGANNPAPDQQAVIEALAIEGSLPERVDDPRWQQAKPSTFRLAPNIVAADRLFTPTNEAVSVQVIYNREEIAFLLSVDDRTDSRPGGAVLEQMPDPDEIVYPDAFAIQFPAENAFTVDPVEKPLMSHGNAINKTTLWYWNAGSVEPNNPAQALLLDGEGLGKPPALRDQQQISDVGHFSGIGQFSGIGRWQDGRWQVLMKRTRISPAAGDIRFEQGRMIPIAFANWDGNNAEHGSRHSFTPWFWLYLAPETNTIHLVGVPVGVSGAMLLLCMLLIRWQRSGVKKAKIFSAR